MERLTKIGEIAHKKSVEIRHSKIGLGFEKLDRNVFEPDKAYPFVAESGVKWARLQSGWQRTEVEKGVYDFRWLDDIVDHMLAAGVEPWICLCYGNQLYTERAKEEFGAVGCPPVGSEEEGRAWSNYVKETAAHFKGRVHYYEVWNEPDGRWCWKHGPNPVELGEFTVATVRACKEADPDCEVIGFATCCVDETDFLEALCETGVCRELDGISYHCYQVADRDFIRIYDIYDGIRQKYNPSLKIFQGESGTQSRSDGCGALRGGAWTPVKQAKFLLRHLIVDIACGVELTSYFSCMDMIEALNGKVGDVGSYLDYGYFGVVGADFDETGRSTGEYTPKLSFGALQNLTSVFCNDYSMAKLPIQGTILPSQRLLEDDYDFGKTFHYGFSKPNGSFGLCYWVDRNILTETYEGTISLLVKKGALPGDVRIADLLTGDVYELPEGMVREEDEDVVFVNLPVKDSPLLLTFGDFL